MVRISVLLSNLSMGSSSSTAAFESIDVSTDGLEVHSQDLLLATRVSSMKTKERERTKLKEGRRKRSSLVSRYF